MNSVVGVGLSDNSEYVEVDPTGRYGRYNEVLGKGASKTVYRGFDEYEGIEVAWNQVKLYDFLQCPEDLERLYCEIHLLKTLKHRNIMKFYTSWVDIANRNINFVTEMFNSGTLRQYRMKHKRVHIRAVKHWCRQILKGLLYLHSRDPPIIHRDLKCDNIFINGNQGEVKIGDLGLAAILRKSHASHCVGTPEFMAPEVYAEEYNELVDIYAFGMCILEMVTFEYPYSECNHPAQIYKKVMSGKKPDSLYKVEDPEVRRFIEKCLAAVSYRLSALELLNDPFLQNDDYVSELEYHHNNIASDNGYSNLFGYEEENNLDYNHSEYEADELELFTSPDDEHLKDVDITIKGKRREDDGIFLRLRIADEEGRVRNIYFPFDIKNDTALSVASEMVSEFDINDQDVTTIADMIDGEIASLVPEWKTDLGMEECHQDESNNNGFCHNCSSTDSVVDLVVSKSSGGQKVQFLECCRQKYGGIHGRFEEITYQFNGSEQNGKEDTLCGQPSQSPNIQYTDIWAQLDVHELISHSSTNNFCGDEHENSYNLTYGNDDCARSMKNEGDKPTMTRLYRSMSAAQAMVEDHENEIRRELRWFKAKYQLQLRELRDQQVSGAAPKPPQSPSADHNDQKGDTNATRKGQEPVNSLHLSDHSFSLSPENSAKKFCDIKILNIEMACGSCSPEPMVTAKKFYTGTFLPSSLHRATSLPVDATEF